MRYLLDTTVISNPIAPVPNPNVVEAIRTNESDCAIAAPVWHELYFGCLRLPPGRRRGSLEQYLADVVIERFPVLPYDRTAADWQAQERARLERIGKPAPYIDSQIAAIAAVNGLTLVTMNTRDFKPFKGLQVVDWSKPRR